MIFTQFAARHVTDWLERGGGITHENREVCEFGLDKLFSSLTTIVFALIFGLFFGIPGLSLVFFITYTAIRVYAGGYHADTPLRCLFISIGIMIPALLIIMLQQVWCTSFSFYFILALCVVILVILAPVGNKNKMPDALEKIVYRRRALRNLSVTAGISAVLFQLSYQDYAVAVLCGILLAVVMVVAGNIKLFLQ